MLLLICSFYSYAQNTGKSIWPYMGNNKGYTFYQVQDDFKQYWQGKTPQKGQGYKVFKRWENYMTPRVYPSGNMALPSSTYPNFLEWRKNNSQTASRSPNGNWTAIGPLSKPSGYDGGVGLVKFVRFDPNNNDIMYAGAPDGGLWKSTDGGDSWNTQTDFLPIIACSDLAIDPANTQNMYLATGNWDGGKKSIGILKSTDGGLNWNLTGLSWTVADNYVITKLLMHPFNPQVMMITTDEGVFRTTDAWATWTHALCCGPLDDMEFKPGDPNTLYAAGLEFWKSTDNGVTWDPVTTGLPAASSISRTALGVSFGNAAAVYALIGGPDGGYLGLYRSVDSGGSFSLQSSSPNLLNVFKDGSGTGGQATHDMAIAVSPADADIVTVGGINQWQSTDGGVNWTVISYWLGSDVNYPGQGDGPPDYVHADIQSIEYQPGSSTVMFATCDGGISKSINNGANWTDISHNLSIAQQTGIALSAISPDIVVTGLQDIGTIKEDVTPWSVINGGDGEDAFIDRTSDNFIITSNPAGAHALSTDGGLTQNGISGLPGNAEWFSPISQDPVNVDLVYAGGRPALWKTLELFSVGADCAWTELGTPSGNGNILQFVVAPSDNTIIYAIKYDAISKSTDAGASWTNINGSLPIGDVFLTDLTISDIDPEKVWITFSGYSGADKVFQTTDSGTNWTNISGGLPNIPVNTIVAMHGSASGAVYIGADIGVFYYDDTLASWTPFFTDLPNCSVTDLEIYYPDGKIRASTYGRGAWESDLYTSEQVGAPAITDNNDGITLVPNPAKHVIEVTGINTDQATIRLTDAAGRLIKTQNLSTAKQIDVRHLPGGIYFIEIQREKLPPVVKRFIKE